VCVRRPFAYLQEPSRRLSEIDIASYDFSLDPSVIGPAPG